MLGVGVSFPLLVRTLLVSLVPFRFRNEVLQVALKAFHKGNELAQQGDYKAAASFLRQGIYMGRPIVLELQQHQRRQEAVQVAVEDDEDNAHLALEWLAQSYVASSQAHLKLGDIDAARADAWGACLVSNNQSRAGLECMLQVCSETGDSIGELSSLKMLLSVVYLNQHPLQQQRDNYRHAAFDELNSFEIDQDDELEIDLGEDDWELLRIKTRIEQLQEELDKKYNRQ
jgi:hypothetical protein